VSHRKATEVTSQDDRRKTESRTLVITLVFNSYRSFVVITLLSPLITGETMGKFHRSSKYPKLKPARLKSDQKNLLSSCTQTNRRIERIEPTSPKSEHRDLERAIVIRPIDPVPFSRQAKEIAAGYDGIGCSFPPALPATRQTKAD
jgi:hypothetical protein